MKTETSNLCADEKLNGYDAHNVVTLDGLYTYEKPVSFERVDTAFGGWWGKALYADGTVINAWRKLPLRQIPYRPA